MNIIKSRVFVFFVCAFFILDNGNANNNPGSGENSISAKMKEQILQSTIHAYLKRNDGKKITAYLYAPDERNESLEYYSCISGEPQTSVSKVGHYHIYLYDADTGSFLRRRTAIFNNTHEARFNVEGAALMVLSGTQEKTSDVLLISQFGDCNGNLFEAYGFSEDNLYLKNYTFVTKQKQNHFYGRIGNDNGGNKLTAYGVYDNRKDVVQKMIIRLSNKNGEIQLKPAR